MKFSIVIPVYNEERTVKSIIDAVNKIKYPGEKEIIVVDDGSTDTTQQKLKSISGIKIVTNKKNKGKGYSLRKAFKLATGEIILIQDADLEYNPADHLKIIKTMLRYNLDVVYGSRFLNRIPYARYKLFYLGNKFLSFLTRLLYGQKITDMETCYKVFRKKVLKNLNLKANRFDFEPEITCKLLRNGYKIVEIPIAYRSRSYEEGKKIKMIDGIQAILTVTKLRFMKN